MVDPSHLFHIADYALFGATIAISLFIGVYYALSGGRQRTTSEYLVGGRKMQYLPVAISLLVSFESSIMMLGEPAEMYLYGVQVWMGNWGTFLAQLISTVVIVPLLHPLHMTSAFEVNVILFVLLLVFLSSSCLVFVVNLTALQILTLIVYFKKIIIFQILENIDSSAHKIEILLHLLCRKIKTFTNGCSLFVTKI